MRRLNSQSGVSFLEFLLVVAVAAILVGMAIPQFMSAGNTARETRALESLRDVAAANESYESRFDRYARDFEELVNSGLLKNVDLRSGYKQGRWSEGYSFQFWSNGQRFFVRCWPDYFGYTGDQAYYVDETGVLRVSTDGVADLNSPKHR